MLLTKDKMVAIKKYERMMKKDRQVTSGQNGCDLKCLKRRWKNDTIDIN